MSQVLNQQQSESSQQQQSYKQIIPNANDLNNNKKQTLRIKQKQNLEIYLKEIGIEIEEEDEELQQIIDTFVSHRITPLVLKTVSVEDLEKSFKELKIAIGFQSQLLTAIKASKVCVKVEILVFIYNRFDFFVLVFWVNRSNNFHFPKLDVGI
jgi:hypothetical protein